MNGAVHGVATSTASSPVKKLPAAPCRSASPLPAPVRPAAALTWNTPDRFSPTASNSHVIAATNTGEANWKPQPAAVPIARAVSNAPARPTNVASTPAV